MMRQALLIVVLTILALIGIAALLGIAAGQLHEADYPVEFNRKP